MSKRDVEITRVDRQVKSIRFAMPSSTALGKQFKAYLDEQDWDGFDLNELRAVHKFLEDFNLYAQALKD